MAYTYHSTEKVECSYCGSLFQPTTHKNTVCPECKVFFQTYSAVRAREGTRKSRATFDEREYQIIEDAKRRAAKNDRIIGEGYAERQIAQSLRLAGKVRTEL